jgi:hypothetical protein
MRTQKLDSRTTMTRDKQQTIPATDPTKIAAVIVEMQEDIAELRRRVDRRPPTLPSVADGWVGLKEAAYQTGYGKESVRIWAASGKVSAKRCGGKWIVNLASVKKQVSAVQKSVREHARFR